MITLKFINRINTLKRHKVSSFGVVVFKNGEWGLKMWRFEFKNSKNG